MRGPLHLLVAQAQSSAEFGDPAREKTMTLAAPSTPHCTVIRPARDDDFEQIAAIYRPFVLETAITFDLDPPGPAEMRRRWRASTEAGAPYLVAESERRIIGYASSRPYAEKAAYAWTLEDSIYLDPAAQGKGIGTILLRALIDAAEQAGFRQILALIAAGQAEASVALHLRAGFVEGGYLKSLGFKSGTWHDVIYMQRQLGPGNTIPPVEIVR